MNKIFCIIFCNLLLVSTVFAANHTINLTITYKTVYFAGKASKAIAINNQIPGPTLHFKEGDTINLNVYNHLDKETAIHWHGILVPWQMDGVLGVSQKGILPGKMFHYHFKLRQAGTYWYHAHAGLQEQQGLYGAFIIDPLKPSHYHYTKDYVIVLSDWSNTDPERILANLKKEGDYYAPNFPLQPSLIKFIHDYRKASTKERDPLFNDYQTMQKMRMSIYDISDVAYDAFLLNGLPNFAPWTGRVNVGDIVRLRFIGASAGTIFRVKIPHTPMQMIHVEGNDVIPYTLKDFTIAPGETYDVLIKIETKEPTIIYAESMDTVGKAYGALVTTNHQIVHYKNVAAFPEPLPTTQEMESMMMGPQQKGTLPATMPIHSKTHMHMHEHSMAHMSNMNHSMMSNSHMSMPTESTILGDSISPSDFSYATSSKTKYEKIIAVDKTNDPNKPVAGTIRMELSGYMDRFIWFINGLPEYKAPPILLKPGKRYRFVFTNTSMMHHPMHIHGHWFILRKGKDAYDPLLHTIDIPPGATITADVDTDASGQWFFHCHLLYHMTAGMARVFQYSTLIELTQNEIKPQNIAKKTAYHNRPIVREDEVRPIDKLLVEHPMAHSAGVWLATFLDVGVDPFKNFQKFTYKGLYGPDYNKLEVFMNDAEINQNKVENADTDIFYWHLISQFWAIKGGINYFYRPATTPYWQPGIGIEGLMPYFIDTDIRSYYYSGSTKLDMELSRDTQITNNFFLRLGIRSILATKTVTQAIIGSGLNQMQYTVRPYYRLMPGLDIFAEYEYERNYGDFNIMQMNEGENTSQNTMTVGLSFLF